MHIPENYAYLALKLGWVTIEWNERILLTQTKHKNDETRCRRVCGTSFSNFGVRALSTYHLCHGVWLWAAGSKPISHWTETVSELDYYVAHDYLRVHRTRHSHRYRICRWPSGCRCARAICIIIDRERNARFHNFHRINRCSDEPKKSNVRISTAWTWENRDKYWILHWSDRGVSHGIFVVVVARHDPNVTMTAYTLNRYWFFAVIRMKTTAHKKVCVTLHLFPSSD